VGLVHTTTKAQVIERFLLLEVGQLCTERQRAESERILRLQPFLADATVRAVPDTADGARIEIETIDELSTVLGLRLHGALPSALRFGNGNVGGQGLYLATTVERGFRYRTGLGLHGVAYQVFGRPYTLALEAERAPLGSTLTLALGHPFLTDLQRSAWHLGYRDGPILVDFDDSAMGPPVQDLWLLARGRDEEARKAREDLLEGYELFREFDRASLALIEPLRAMRIVHMSGWIAKRWEDPSFPHAYPNFKDVRYWMQEYEALVEIAEQLG
jgi:hypothetical protein